MDEIVQVIQNDDGFKEEVSEEINEALAQNLVSKNELLKLNIYGRKKANMALKVAGKVMENYEDQLEEKDETIIHKENEINEKNYIITEYKNVIGDEKINFECIEKGKFRSQKETLYIPPKQTRSKKQNNIVRNLLLETTKILQLK